MRSVLFISHATPEDNEIAAWLAAKLELHGYCVWVDIKSLDPSSDSWGEMESTIRENTIRFLFVATKHSVLGNRDGIKKELAVADSVRKKVIPNFIVPLRFDDMSFGDFSVEIIRRQAIDFHGDWAEGLIQLLEYLEKHNIEKTIFPSEKIEKTLQRWKDVSTSDKAKVINKTDYYYSNLFPIKLSNYLYIYNNLEIEQILKSKHIPYKKIGNCIATLACSDCIQQFYGSFVPFEKLELYNILKSDISIESFSTLIKQPHNLCVSLINWNIDNLFFRSGLKKYKATINNQSKNRYYFERGYKSKRAEKSRFKSLSGSYRDKFWHYAQSAYYTNFPYEGIIFRAHLLFTDNNNTPISDNRQITARRSKGRLFFNNEWRNMLQAAIYSYAEGKDNIVLNLCCNSNVLIIESRPYTFSSEKGYIEPVNDPIESFTEGHYENEEE